MQPSITIIAGRPAMGKTTFTLQLAINAAEIREVLFFSFEMSETQLSNRILALEPGAENLITESGENGANNTTAVISRETSLPLHIHGRHDLSIPVIKSQVQKNIDSNPLVIIDYFQLVVTDKSISGRHEQYDMAADEIRNICQEWKVPVLILSQLYRTADARADKRPLKSDLAAPDSLANAAAQIVFMYRERYYRPDPPVNQVELIIPEHGDYENSTLITGYDDRKGKIIF